MKIQPPYALWSDDELLKQFIKTSNQELLRHLYSRYVQLVYGLCLKYLKQIEDAEDAVSSIYEKLVSKVHKYQIVNFKTWLYSVSKNYCINILKQEKKWIFEEINNQIVESDNFECLIDVNEDKEKENALNNCLEALPEKQRICIVQFFFEDFSYADIVEKTGFILNKVKSYIQNGKRNLKICIQNKMKS
jgi:RNA polymerase sigma-70 factor (ECF subfamily)